MKIQCTVQNFKQAINKAERVVGKNNSTPVVQSIYLEARDNVLTIRSTNLHTGVELQIPVQMDQEGFCGVEGGVLGSMVGSILSEGKMTLELKDSVLLCTTDKIKTKIKTVPVDDFPTLPKVAGDVFTIKAGDFISGVRSVSYSASSTDIKPEIASVYVYSKETNLFFVATDSFRLAEKRIQLGEAGASYSFIIPNSNISDLVWLLQDKNESEVSVEYNDNQISFSGDGFWITSRLVDGNFPNYNLIIPKEVKTSVVMLKKDLIQSLNLSNTFANRFNQAKLVIELTSKKVRLETKNDDIGQSEIELDAAIEGEPLEISFNYKYLSDCFQSIAVDSVSLEFVSPTKPIIVRGVGQKDFLYLIMPTNR